MAELRIALHAPRISSSPSVRFRQLSSFHFVSLPVITRSTGSTGPAAPPSALSRRDLVSLVTTSTGLGVVQPPAQVKPANPAVESTESTLPSLADIPDSLKWLAGYAFAGLSAYQTARAFTDKAETTAKTVAKVVEEAAEAVEKAAEELEKVAPNLKKEVELLDAAAHFVEQNAHGIEEFLEKVDEVEEKLDELLKPAASREGHHLQKEATDNEEKNGSSTESS